ncbi:MAG: aminotransferase, partial [Patescibacteria group bacterium]
MMVRFKDGVLSDKQQLAIANEKIRALIEKKAEGAKPDQRFAYYLLGATGIVVVPASGFFSPYFGFRITTLTRDENELRAIYKRLAEAIQAYLNS